MSNVYVTHWHSEYTDEYWAHSSNRRARHNLFEEVKTCWQPEYGPIPTDEEEAIKKYFEINDEEWANIEPLEIDADESVPVNVRA